MRLHLFEFEDLSWFPQIIRQGGTDYLRYFLNAVRYYEPVTPVIAEALRESGNDHIIDLCSGGGGAIEQVHKKLQAEMKNPVTITLSDKFPNVNAYLHIRKKSKGAIDFIAESVDATQVSPNIKGFRTMFSAVHHFQPATVKQILKNAVDNNAGIALFDGGDKNIFTILGIIFFHPIAFFFCTPFFKPFRFSRIVFTYFIPLIPLMTVWDGCISILRLYKPADLMNIAGDIHAKHYRWKTGKVKNSVGMKVTYLIGYPLPDQA